MPHPTAEGKSVPVVGDTEDVKGKKNSRGEKKKAIPALRREKNKSPIGETRKTIHKT